MGGEPSEETGPQPLVMTTFTIMETVTVTTSGDAVLEWYNLDVEAKIDVPLRKPELRLVQHELDEHDRRLLKA